jgi:chromosome segregation ATPase
MISTATKEERLAAIGRRIDVLQWHLKALREQESAVRSAGSHAADEVEGKLVQLQSRLAVAENSLAADLADDRSEFVAAVESELRSLGAYLERLQTQAAAQSGESRDHAEAAIGDLRKRRVALAERARFALASGDAWQQHKQDLAAAHAELERQADELANRLQERR